QPGTARGQAARTLPAQVRPGGTRMSTPPPLQTAAALRAAGRHPVLPLRAQLADGRSLTVHRLLRVLPGKRLVGEAEFEGRRVLAKLFIAPASARHWQRERSGIEALAAAALPT